MNSVSTQARLVTKDKLYGVLASQSYSMAGYPFGSLVQFSFDGNGDIIMYLSDIAQHTKNIRHDNKVSLTVVNDNLDDIQNSARVTILGYVEECQEYDAGVHPYNRLFPEALAYRQVHDFKFYRLNITRVRYIGGFGDIHWVKSEEFRLCQQFQPDEISAVIEHMNRDHIHSMQKYLNQFDTNKIEMLYFDQEGMWLKSGKQSSYVAFHREAANMSELRKVLIEMSKNADSSQQEASVS